VADRSAGAATIASSLRRLGRLSFLLAIRYTPLPWRVKEWLIWLFGPKVLFAAFALVRDAQGRVLALRSRYSGAWQLPGGCATRGEPALETLRRECREELSLEIRGPRLLGVYVDMQGLSQCAVYDCELGEGTIRLSEEHTECRYVHVDELPSSVRKMAVDATISTL